ncbi:endonuclease III [bacterium]|nr:endonuclease III [bacterium]NIN91424.1 endonuclease III [bacterium]NIO17834.1 endonuclease III [bacterium]NIO72815.1 endonuclease III [bacterium]
MSAKNIDKILPLLKKEYPRAKIALDFSNPLEILVATVLSAQCTDERVNMVTKSIFKKYRKAQDYARANLKTFEQEIRSTGFYRNKAKNIISAAKKIVNDFNNKLPDSMDKLLQLPGVARKTANIVLFNGFGKVEGIAVDTHVRRLSQRLGFTKNQDPNKIEQDLMKLLDKKEWGKFSYLLIDHGRKICEAKKPKCLECILQKLCPSRKDFYA